MERGEGRGERGERGEGKEKRIVYVKIEHVVTLFDARFSI